MDCYYIYKKCFEVYVLVLECDYLDNPLKSRFSYWNVIILTNLLKSRFLYWSVSILINRLKYRFCSPSWQDLFCFFFI